MFKTFYKPFFHLKSNLLSFCKLCLTKKQSHSSQPREIPSRRSLELLKMPFEIRHFVETNFYLRKDRSTHSISIISMDLTQKSENEINKVWECAGKRNHLNERSIQRLNTRHSPCLVIYLLTKTHKLPDNIPNSNLVLNDIKVRLIIFCCGGPTDKVSWLIQVISNPPHQPVKHRTVIEKLTQHATRRT